MLLLALLLPLNLNFISASENINSNQSVDRDIRLIGKNNTPKKKSLLIVEGYYQGGRLVIDFGGLIANESVNTHISSDTGIALLNDMVYVDNNGLMELYIDLTGYEYLWLEITSVDYSFSGEI